MIAVRRAWLAGVLLLMSGTETVAQAQPPGFPDGSPKPAGADQPKVPPISAEYARCMETGIALVNAKQYRKARTQFESAVTIAEKHGTIDVQLAQSLSWLACTLTALKKYDEAEPVYKRSLTIYEKAWGNDHQIVANVLGGLAGNDRYQKKYAEAETLYQRALAIYVKTWGPKNAKVAQTYGHLASLYADQEQFAKAESFRQKALETYEAVWGEKDPAILEHRMELAKLKRALGKNVEAERLYRRTYEILVELKGPNHPAVAVVLDTYADLLRKEKRDADAEKLETRARSIRAQQVAGASSSKTRR
jgi:tetratricopeptide (TPR) repeat protein